MPYPEGPPVQRSEAGLDHGSTSTYQSPSFRRIHDAPETVPSALGPRPPRPPSPPSEKMKNVRIDEGNVVKTSYKPPREFTSNQPVPKLFKWHTTKTILCCEQSDHVTKVYQNTSQRCHYQKHQSEPNSTLWFIVTTSGTLVSCGSP